jgi:hypothetical protein
MRPFCQLVIRATRVYSHPPVSGSMVREQLLKHREMINSQSGNQSEKFTELGKRQNLPYQTDSAKFTVGNSLSHLRRGFDSLHPLH